jgi:hypothetical protein
MPRQPQLPDSHRVVGAVVISGDSVEVRQTIPVLVPGADIQPHFKQHGWVSGDTVAVQALGQAPGLDNGFKTKYSVVVISGDSVEVRQTIPVLVPGADIQPQQTGLLMVAVQALGQAPGLDNGFKTKYSVSQLSAAGLTPTQPLGNRLHRDSIAAHPTVLFKVVRHATDGINRIPQVDMTVGLTIRAALNTSPLSWKPSC